MGPAEFFKRLLGVSATPPAPEGSWRVEGASIVVDLNAAPELAAPGGAYRLEGGALAKRVLVMRGGDGLLRAYINRCTHGGRRLDRDPVGDGLRCCSVGRSTFDLAGNKTGGPAKGPITELAVEAKAGEMVVALSPGDGG